MKTTTLLLSSLLIVSLLTGCGSETAAVESTNDSTTATTTENTDSTTITNTSDIELNTDGIEVEYKDSDTQENYDTVNATTIQLSDDASTYDGKNVVIDGNTITIEAEGQYILAGELSNGQVIVNASDDADVRLILDGVSVHNENGPALLVNSSDKVIVTLASGSTNTFTDSTDYAEATVDDPEATIYSSEDLSFNGSGTLIVEGNYNDAIKSSDDLVITNGTYIVTAVNVGLKGVDSVSVSGGTFEIDSENEAIKSTNTEDSLKGWVSIDGGSFTITSNDKGIEGYHAVFINGGTLDINVSNDGIHSNGDIEINGGNITLSAGDDGMHADNNLTVNNGYINVLNSYEGLEGANVIMNDGVVYVKASDDGVNAAGGSDGNVGNDKFFQPNATNGGSYLIQVNGGELYVISEGDGIDSNGDIELLGGTITVESTNSGPEIAIDIDRGTLLIEDATVIAYYTNTQMYVTPTTNQGAIEIVFDSYSSDAVTISDSKGNVIVETNPSSSYKAVMISSPDLELDETYTVTYENGNEIYVVMSNPVTITEDGQATTISGGMGGGGFNPGTNTLPEGSTDGNFQPGGREKPGHNIPSNEDGEAYRPDFNETDENTGATTEDDGNN